MKAIFIIFAILLLATVAICRVPKRTGGKASEKAVDSSSKADKATGDATNTDVHPKDIKIIGDLQKPPEGLGFPPHESERKEYTNETQRCRRRRNCPDVEVVRTAVIRNNTNHQISNRTLLRDDRRTRQRLQNLARRLLNRLRPKPTPTPTVDPIPKVVDGEDADPGEWPWQARVIWGNYLCGGVLIHGCYVLTAAHCADAHKSAYTVILGDHNRIANDGTEQYRQVLKIIKHPSYDAAIFLLKTGTDTSVPEVGPVPILASSLPQVGTMLWVTGWGWFQSQGFQAATILQKLKLPLANSATCGTQLNPILQSYGVSPVQGHEVCAGDPAGSYANACHGDSGGPLVWYDGTNWQLVGIVSRGVPQCPSNVDYALYVSIPAIRSWIQQYVPSANAAPGASCACLHDAIRYLPTTTTTQPAQFDGANCLLGPARQGCGQHPTAENKAFIYQNRFYETSSRAIECLKGLKDNSFTWDSCNCFLRTIPAGVNDFLYNNGYYVDDVNNACPVIGSWDLANCHYETAPWGTEAFKWSGNWYSTARPTCDPPFTYDGANCYWQSVPPGGFIWFNCYWIQTSIPGICPPNTTPWGPFCFVRCAPWATNAFSYANNWYHTPRRQCDDGRFDGANCLHLKPPLGATAFEWQQKWYYGWF